MVDAANGFDDGLNLYQPTGGFFLSSRRFAPSAVFLSAV